MVGLIDVCGVKSRKRTSELMTMLELNEEMVNIGKALEIEMVWTCNEDKELSDANITGLVGRGRPRVEDVSRGIMTRIGLNGDEEFGIFHHWQKNINTDFEENITRTLIVSTTQKQWCRFANLLPHQVLVCPSHQCTGPSAKGGQATTFSSRPTPSLFIACNFQSGSGGVKQMADCLRRDNGTVTST